VNLQDRHLLQRRILIASIALLEIDVCDPPLPGGANGKLKGNRHLEIEQP
jgi:hypothetical protein